MPKNDQSYKNILAGAVSGGIAALVVGFLVFGGNPGDKNGNFFDNFQSSILNNGGLGFT